MVNLGGFVRIMGCGTIMISMGYARFTSFYELFRIIFPSVKSGEAQTTIVHHISFADT